MDEIKADDISFKIKTHPLGGYNLSLSRKTDKGYVEFFKAWCQTRNQAQYCIDSMSAFERGNKKNNG